MPRGRDDIVTAVLVAKVLTELWNANHRAGSLDVEAKQDHAPDGEEAPGAGQRVRGKARKEAQLVVLLIPTVGNLLVDGDFVMHDWRDRCFHGGVGIRLRDVRRHDEAAPGIAGGSWDGRTIAKCLMLV